MAGAGAMRDVRHDADDLFARIGDLLRAQGLSPDPANYGFAHQLLTRDDTATTAIVRRVFDEGVRLTRHEIDVFGGGVVAGAPSIDGDHARDAGVDEKAERADRLVAATRVQADAVAAMARTMHDQTRAFGRDLAQSAAAIDDDGAPIDAGEVIRLTTTMIRRAAATEERLADAMREADGLRAALAEAEASARRDPLTGLANRRAFDEAFGGLDPAGTHCLALCDVDRFKRINDEFGHAVGDRVLTALARLLSAECAGHLVTRQGGEEFAVLLRGTDLDEAERVLGAARTAAAARRLRERDSDAPIGRVTFSAGIVAIAAGESRDDALARADRLLYRAKAEGRDRVVAG